MVRKYFRSSIQELEVLFKDQNDSIDTLQAIQDELTHRTTDRAARLRNRVTDRLAVLSKGAHKETAHEPPRVPSHQPLPISRVYDEDPASPPPQIQPDRTIPASEALRREQRMEQQPPLPPVTNQTEEVL